MAFNTKEYNHYYVKNKDHLRELNQCHQTGKVRGLLCNTCNAGLGNFRDAIAHLQAAIRYLESRG